MRQEKPKSLQISVIALLMWALVVLPLAADETARKAGTRAFAFLKRDVGARPVGMGGAFTGFADDETTLFYNPGATVNLDGRRGIAGYQNFIAGINAGFLGYLHPLGEREKIGGFINYIDYGSFIRTDNTGAELGEFGGGSFVFGLNYSREIGAKFQAGGNAKLIYSDIESFTATGLAVDLGLRYKIKEQPREFRKRGYGAVGLTVQNLGGMLSTFAANAEKDPLPIIFRLGVAGRPRGVPLHFAGDVILPADNDIQIALGAEYAEIEYLALRAGWASFGENFRTVADDGALAGFSFGVGFDFERMNIGYSISPMNDLGESHRITVTHRFDTPLER
ncbi:MAG: PorV/PorQ family protein [Candidatus Zixiibacteriota bacterium]